MGICLDLGIAHEQWNGKCSNGKCSNGIPATVPVIVVQFNSLLNSHPRENGNWPLKGGWLLNRGKNNRKALIRT